MVVDLQGPWNVKGCVMNVFPVGTMSVGVLLPMLLEKPFFINKKFGKCIRFKKKKSRK
jgi:hypothetical protein